jgi:hypothetical protein
MFTPTIIKVLKYLRDTKAKKTKEEIAVIIGESPEYVNKALEKLIAVNVVVPEEGAYYYNSTTPNNELAERLMELYEITSRKPAKELLIRGLMCQIPYQHLFHLPTLIELLEKEEIEEQELDQFLEQEIANGYLEMTRVIFHRYKVIPICMFPDYSSYPYYYPDGYRSQDSRCEFKEENYLIVQYPPELANPAKEYIERERTELVNNLRRKGVVGK